MRSPGPNVSRWKARRRSPSTSPHSRSSTSRRRTSLASPCLRLAYEAAAASQKHCIALNAADEIAVEAFLRGELPFPGIPRTIERVLALTQAGSPASIQEVLSADLYAREQARECLLETPISRP